MEYGKLIAMIVILTLLLVLVGIVYYAYHRIRNKVRFFSGMVFGTRDATPSGAEGAFSKYQDT